MPTPANRLATLDVMVVDDNAHMRTLVAAILRGFGLSAIHESGDGGHAMGELRDRPIDLIFTDMRMDPIDGIEFTHMLRTAPDSPAPFIPIIMMTGYCERSHVTAARDAGVTEFLAKPITARAIWERVIECVDRPRPFVRCKSYTGPDRRRHADKAYNGALRRKDDCPIEI